MKEILQKAAADANTSLLKKAQAETSQEQQVFLRQQIASRNADRAERRDACKVRDLHNTIMLIAACTIKCISIWTRPCPYLLQNTMDMHQL